MDYYFFFYNKDGQILGVPTSQLLVKRFKDENDDMFCLLPLKFELHLIHDNTNITF